MVIVENFVDSFFENIVKKSCWGSGTIKRQFFFQVVFEDNYHYYTVSNTLRIHSAISILEGQ